MNPPTDQRVTRALMLVVDVGFVVYWLLIAGSVLPAATMFPEYDDARVQAWNWSFLPLDLAASVTGLVSLALWRRGRDAGKLLMAVSLTLTLCAGLMAVAYWTFRGQFDLTWWAPNLFLIAFPLLALRHLVRPSPADAPSRAAHHALAGPRPHDEPVTGP